MADIGSTLREARMRERIDISEVEAQTKIRAKYLRAIENEEWDLLPGSVYAKSFLRTYGDYLGLDSRMLLDEFRRRYEHQNEHDARPAGSVAVRERDRDRRAPRPRLPSWAPIGVVVVVILAILYVIGLGTKSSHPSPAVHKPPAHRHHRPTRTTPAPAPRRANLQLTPTGPVYVCLVDGHGTKLINERTFSTGQIIPAQSGSKLLLTLGNASVRIKVNGKGVAIAPSASAIRLSITPTAVRHIPLSQSPTCP